MFKYPWQNFPLSFYIFQKLKYWFFALQQIKLHMGMAFVKLFRVEIQQLLVHEFAAKLPLEFIG